MGVDEESSVGRGEGIALPLPLFWFGVDMLEAYNMLLPEMLGLAY